MEDFQPSIEDGNWRAFYDTVMPPILRAALSCFADKGFHGTSIRQIADRAGLSVPGLYHHWKSKYDLLLAVIRYAMTDLAARSDLAEEQAGASSAEQLDAYVECMVLFHAKNQQLAFVAASELRSIHPDDRPDYVALRDAQHARLSRIVQRGAADGEFSVPYPREAVTAVISMCTGISQWYRADGPLRPEQLAGRFRHIARGAVGAVRSGSAEP
ncbi:MULTISPECIES: TetR/AcrR family transcriptional regulator [unclassified Brevibacterium]|uniref:TetR/AcrR family transcriptional regulator n=1 Tax=unclassified Brevibacterium TaxID=2614124 RepID=UPI0008A211C5|nr:MULTISPECIES: TetR/AcrR family transcriptional regulator [unclassified Brevibacterium]OFL64142.1 hypothetical protein HMPREF2757_01385 [Brevibacterium sp. HMSC063G07]OFS26448.1 hypothetical protein HMPREF3162_06665 [Brevibacterium sp. HMSC07C04]